MSASVQVRTDVSGMPHTFLVVTHPDGRVVEYGLVPKEDGSPFSPGKIDITGESGPDGPPHEYDAGTRPQPLSDAQYQKLMQEINRAIGNPPEYNLNP